MNETMIANAKAIQEGVLAIVHHFGLEKDETLDIFSSAYRASMKESGEGIDGPRIITGRASSRRVFIGTHEDEDAAEIRPAESLKLRNHSPDGFSWGYTGSGPSQLALAILLEVAGRAIAEHHYQEFKREIISGLPTDKDFVLEVDKIREWIKSKRP